MRRHHRAVVRLDRVERMGGTAETVEEARCEWQWPEALLVEPAPKRRSGLRIERRCYARAA